MGHTGGQGGIRTRGGCYTTHAFQACALNRSATCPSDAVGRSYSAVGAGGNGIFPGAAGLGRVPARVFRGRCVVPGARLAAARHGGCGGRARWARVVERGLVPPVRAGRAVVAARYRVPERGAGGGAAASVGVVLDVGGRAGADCAGGAGVFRARGVLLVDRRAEPGARGAGVHRWRADTAAAGPEWGIVVGKKREGGRGSRLVAHDPSVRDDADTSPASLAHLSQLDLGIVDFEDSEEQKGERFQGPPIGNPL